MVRSARLRRLIQLLDTNVLIDILRNENAVVRENYDSARLDDAELAISTLAAEEVLYGAAISRRPDIQLAAARRLISQFIIADWTLPYAEASAAIRARLRQLGRSIGTIDALIAGQALARDWTLVTSNIREFQRIEGLNVIDWRGQAA